MSAATVPEDPTLGKWDKEERNNLFYLSQICCDRSLMSLILGRSEDHIYSKIQKHITLLGLVWEAITVAIKDTGVSPSDPTFNALFKRAQAKTLRLNEPFHRYLEVCESMSQFLMFGSPNQLIESRFEYVSGQLEDQMRLKTTKRLLINREKLGTKHDNQDVRRQLIPAYISRHVDKETG